MLQTVENASAHVMEEVGRERDEGGRGERGREGGRQREGGRASARTRVARTFVCTGMSTSQQTSKRCEYMMAGPVL